MRSEKSRAVGVACHACGKLIINWDPHDGIGGYFGPPLCLSCVQVHDAVMFPKKTLLESLVLRLLWHRSDHRHIDTRGPDPYAGERWTVTLGKLQISMDNTITWHVQVFWSRGRRRAPKILWSRYFYSARDVHHNPLIRTMLWVYDVLERERDRTYVEDSYGCLADYE